MLETFETGLPSEIYWLTEQLMRAACQTEVRLAVAESCTGGLLSALMTDVEGCAHAFDRGFVVYTDEAKQEVLGVPAAMIAQYGAVSARVAQALATAALDKSKADFALSITGYAGKGAPDEEPGLVYFGLAGRGMAPEVFERRFADGHRRAAVRIACLRFGLGVLRNAVDLARSDSATPSP